jgi:hypothetical protein
LAAVFVAPAMAMERTRACVAGKVTPSSYTWNFKAEANQIFQYIKVQAQDAKYDADQLAVLNPDGPDQMSWRNDIDQLNHVRGDLNRIESKICRLETIRRVVDPEQQRTIDQIAVSARLMADNLQDAYTFGNAHSHELWTPAFQKNLKNLYSEASTMTHSVDQAVQYAKLSKEDREVARKIGELRTGS